MGGSAAYINGIACAASMIDADGCQAPSRPSLKPLIGSPAFALTTIVLLSKCYGSDPRLADPRLLATAREVSRWERWGKT